MDIYVGNLAFSTNDEGLWETFEAFGDVSSAKVIRDRETKRSRGFGFVTMSDDEAGNRAIEELSGKEVDGRVLVVREAEPRKPREGGGGGGGFRKGPPRPGGGNRDFRRPDRGGFRGERGDRGDRGDRGFRR